MTKTFSTIDHEAYEKAQELTKSIKEKLEKTKYEVILNHKQVIMIRDFLESKDGTDRTDEEFDLLDVIVHAQEVKQ